MDLSKWKLSAKMKTLAEELLYQAMLKGHDVRITSGLRTQAEQNTLYAQGRTAPGKIVTWTTNSKHIGGNAIDICFNGNNPYPTNFNWEKLGVIGEELGLRWGGRFKAKDNVHFEI